MADSSTPRGRAGRLDAVLTSLLRDATDLEAAAVVSHDGLPMASALPPTMDEDRVAAMSAALLSLGERAADGLGRGYLNQVYIEGEHGTVFLVSAQDEAVLVAVAARSAKVGLVLFELKRAAAAVGAVLQADEPVAEPVLAEPVRVAVPAAPVVAPADGIDALDAWAAYAAGSSLPPSGNGATPGAGGNSTGGTTPGIAGTSWG